MALSLPLVDRVAGFPGVDPWLAQLPGKLGKAVRADIRLLCVPLSGALSYPFDFPDDEEHPQQALDALSAAAPGEVLRRVLERLAGATEDRDPETVRRRVDSEPERVIRLLASLEQPSRDDPLTSAPDRVLALLRRPAELKAMVERRLRQIGYDHDAPHWRDALPVCRSLAQEARRRFHLGDGERVLQSIVGRRMQDRMALLRGKHIVLVPVPFPGPYVATAFGPDLPAAYVVFGTVHGDGVSEAFAQRDLGRSEACGALRPLTWEKTDCGAAIA